MLIAVSDCCFPVTLIQELRFNRNNQIDIDMKKILSGLGIAIFMLIALSSCADPEASALLTDHTWKFDEMTTDHEDEAIQLLVLGISAGYTHATLNFDADDTYILDIPLSQQDPETGTWTLIGDDQLILDDDNSDYPQTFNIETLSEDHLKYLQTLIDPQSQKTFTLTTSWVK